MQPRDFPAQFGRDPNYANPGVTLPLPSPTEMPRPVWHTPKTPFRWTFSAFNITPPEPVGPIYTYNWTTPAFDLRPDLRSEQASPKDGQPVWSTASRLYIQLSGNPSIGVGASGPGSQPALTGGGTGGSYTVHAIDWVNATTNYSADRRPTEAVTGGAGLLNLPARDVSADFAFGTSILPTPTSILVGFAPPGTGLGGGEGYPVRYWRLQLQFSILIETGLPEPVPLPVPNGNIPSVLWASVY